MSDAPVFVLVHGAFHGAWCWERLVPALEARGARCVAVDRPGAGREADVAALQATVDGLHARSRRVIAVGHSLGCATVQALAPERVDHVVFLAGSVRGPGLPESTEGIEPSFFDALTTLDDGRTAIDPARALDFFYADCAPDVARAAADRLTPDRIYGPAWPREGPIWDTTPATYLWCANDAVVRPDHQRAIAKHMHHAEGFDTGHSPMLCAPDALADALGRVLERTPAR